MADRPIIPDSYKAAGRQLWASVVGSDAQFDLDPHELELLAQACRVADIIASLDERVSREGEMISDPKRGIDIAHPALVETRLQRIVMARLLVALRLPADEAGQRPQRRGMRGAYRPGGLHRGA